MANLYVGNLSFEVTDEGLEQVFSGKGFQVASARVIRDRESGRSRGFGFVELGAGEDSARAIAELNGHNLERRQSRVNEARPQAPRDGGGSATIGPYWKDQQGWPATFLANPHLHSTFRIGRSVTWASA